MRSTDLDEPVFNWNALLNTINYGIVGEYLTWVQENWEDLGKLEDEYYWRGKMNGGEQAMAKHANRGGSWLPARLRDQRKALVKNLFLYLDNKVVTKGPPIPTPKDSCFQCGTTNRDIEEYVFDFKDRIDYKNKEESMSGIDEYSMKAKKIVSEMAADYSKEVHIAAQQYVPSWRSQYMTYNFNWSLCSACYTKKMTRMLSILSKDLNMLRNS